MTEYAVVIERGSQGYGAYVPDLPGCVATADSRQEAERLIKEAIARHVQLLRESGEPVPAPTSSISKIEAP